MIGAVSAMQGTSATYQANFAAMQQQLTQQLFQAADTNGDGSVSQSEFENFYGKFMGSNSQSSAATTAAADQLYQQLNTTGTGLNATQFASALKQMMSQKAQGHHHHHGAGAGGAAGSASSASANPTAWLNSFLAASSQNGTVQAGSTKTGDGLEFTA